jgi:hypothetical protein
MSLSGQILIGLVAGVAVGLFFGETVAPLQIVADGFIKLLQMTVLRNLSDPWRCRARPSFGGYDVV